jgi:hypothetical protein
MSNEKKAKQEYDFSAFDKEIAKKETQKQPEREYDFSAFDAQMVEEEASATEAGVAGAIHDLSMGTLDEVKGYLEAAGQTIGIKGLGKEFGEQEFTTPIAAKMLTPGSMGAGLEEMYRVYKEGRDFERQRHKELKEQYTGAYQTGEVVGMLAPILATGGAFAVRRLLGSGAKELAEQAGKKVVSEAAEELAEQTGKKINPKELFSYIKNLPEETKKDLLQLGATGAGFGGAAAAGYSETEALEEPMELLKEIGTGAAAGATFSYALPGGLKMASKGKEWGGKLLKAGGKQMVELMGELEAGTVDKVLKNAHKFKNMMHYPEMRKSIEKKVFHVYDDIQKIFKKADATLSNKKEITKESLIEAIEKQINEITGTAHEVAIPKLKEILNYIDTPNTTQKLKERAVRKLKRKMDLNSVQDDVILKQELADKDALNKLVKKLKSYNTKKKFYGEPVEYSKKNITKEGNEYVVYDKVGNKLFQEPIKQVKDKMPQYGSIEYDKVNNVMIVKDKNTGIFLKQQLDDISEAPERFKGSLLSQKDLHKTIKNIDDLVYGSGKDEGLIKAQLKLIRRNFDTVLKKRAPKEYTKYSDEMSERFGLLNDFDKKLGVKIEKKIDDVSEVLIKDRDTLTRKLKKELGKEGDEGVEVTELIERLQNFSTKDTITLAEQAELNRIMDELNKKSAGFNYQMKTIVATVLGSMGGPVGAALGALAGISSKPAARSLLKNMGKTQERLSRIPSIPGQVKEGVKTLGTAAALGQTIKAGAKEGINTTVSEKLDDPDYLDSLLKKLKASDKPGEQYFTERVEDLANEYDPSERSKLQFELKQQPAFRKLLKDYEDVKKK